MPNMKPRDPRIMKEEDDSYLKPGQKDENDSYVGKPYSRTLPKPRAGKPSMGKGVKSMPSKKNALKKAASKIGYKKINTSGLDNTQM